MNRLDGLPAIEASLPPRSVMNLDVAREVEELRARARACLPQIDGELRVPGLKKPVSVVRDVHGVPHIRASCLHDLWFAQGFVHAQDRLWQMEAGRRGRAGTLAEIIGEDALDSDRLRRRVGFIRAAEREWAQANEASRAAIEPYVTGVNAYLALGGPLSIEFELLGYRPQAWTAVDVITLSKVASYNQSIPFARKLANLALLRALGPEAFVRLFPWYPPEAPVIVPPGEKAGSLRWDLRPLLEMGQQMADLWGGSNNWAVNGTMTTTGRPLLAADSHVPPDVPLEVYLCHLICPEFSAIGSWPPGIPGVAGSGHNGYVAWCGTTPRVDAQDLFIEQLDGGDPPRYRFRDEWLPVQVHREEIRVKGREEPVVEIVYETHHGPIVSGGPGEPGSALALSWVQAAPTQAFSAIVPRHSARTVMQMIEAHRQVSHNGNRVFADTSGNIGYLLSGRLPKRRGGPAHFPVPGWTGEHEWEGWIPFEEMPQSVNPPSHFVNTSNNLIVRPDHPHYVSAGPFAPYRAQRIASLLRSQAPHSVESFAAIQGDVYTIPGHLVARRVARVEPAEQRGRYARDLLSAWDGHVRMESAAAAVCEVMLGWLSDATLGQIRNSLPEPKPAESHIRILLLARIVEAIERDEALLLERLPYKSWDVLLALALDAAAAHLDEKCGSDEWAWGRLHLLEFRHTLRRTERERALYTVGPFPVSGDGSTPCMTASAGSLDFRAELVPVTRKIIDLDDVRRSVFIVAPGQSGHIASPHYADLVDDFLNLRYRPLLWDAADIEANAEGRLILTP